MDFVKIERFSGLQYLFFVLLSELVRRSLARELRLLRLQQFTPLLLKADGLLKVSRA